jgi:hypothetical protein
MPGQVDDTPDDLRRHRFLAKMTHHPAFPDDTGEFHDAFLSEFLAN